MVTRDSHGTKYIRGTPRRLHEPSASSRSGNYYCDSTPQNWFDGFEDSKAAWGASAWIITRTGSSCTVNDPAGNADFEVAWSMVCGNSCSSTSQYAQSGYNRNRDWTYNEFFAEYTNPSCNAGFCDKFLGNTYNGDNYPYYSVYNSSQHDIQMFAAGNVLMSTGYDPANPNDPDHWSSPWHTEYNGETFNGGDDVPGTSSAMASFTSVAYATTQWNGSGSPSFTNVNDSPFDNSFPTKRYYSFKNSGSSAFNIYTSGTC